MVFTELQIVFTTSPLLTARVRDSNEILPKGPSMLRAVANARVVKISDDSLIGIHVLVLEYEQRPDLGINTTLTLCQTDGI